MSNDEGMSNGSNDEKDAVLRAFPATTASQSWGVRSAAFRNRNDEFLMTNDEGMSNDESRDEKEMEFWFGDSGAVREEPSDSPRYDLEERTARFGEAVIDFANSVPQNAVTSRLITQLVGAGTSVGANCCEGDDAVSHKEFFLRMGTCKKEARETKHFLRMVVRAVPNLKSAARDLWREARELHLIFAKICRNR